MANPDPRTATSTRRVRPNVEIAPTFLNVESLTAATGKKKLQMKAPQDPNGGGVISSSQSIPITPSRGSRTQTLHRKAQSCRQ